MKKLLYLPHFGDARLAAILLLFVLVIEFNMPKKKEAAHEQFLYCRRTRTAKC